eukprot:COSAG02_NODE_3268_length_7047_cov_3.408463_2_plen_1489_part_00
MGCVARPTAAAGILCCSSGLPRRTEAKHSKHTTHNRQAGRVLRNPYNVSTPITVTVTVTVTVEGMAAIAESLSLCVPAGIVMLYWLAASVFVGLVYKCVALDGVCFSRGHMWRPRAGGATTPSSRGRLFVPILYLFFFSNISAVLAMPTGSSTAPLAAAAGVTIAVGTVAAGAAAAAAALSDTMGTISSWRTRLMSDWTTNDVVAWVRTLSACLSTVEVAEVERIFRGNSVVGSQLAFFIQNDANRFCFCCLLSSAQLPEPAATADKVYTALQAVNRVAPAAVASPAPAATHQSGTSRSPPATVTGERERSAARAAARERAIDQDASTDDDEPYDHMEEDLHPGRALRDIAEQPAPNSDDEEHVPKSYNLYNVGDKVKLFGGGERIVTEHMHSLLGDADNTLARIPNRLVEPARGLIGNIVLANVATMRWDERIKVLDVDSDMWTDSVLVHWNNARHEHLIMIPEQAGKTGEMALICLYQFLACGCAPVVTVRNMGGRMGGGAMMEQELRNKLSGDAEEKGFVPSVKDFLRHIAELHPGVLKPVDWTYFHMEANLKPAGRGSMYARSPGNLSSPWAVHILLQNDSNISHIAKFARFMRDQYGAKVDGERSRIVNLNDEDDLNYSGGGAAAGLTRPQRAMQKARAASWHNISVTATASTILLDFKVQVYIRSKLADNYYGIANGRVDWFEFDESNLKAKPVLMPFVPPWFAGLRSSGDIPFPAFGEDAKKCLTGKGTTADYSTIELAKYACIDMCKNPDLVIDGWRHANVVLRRSDSQQYAAIYFASLASQTDLITMEWHSLSVRCTKFYADSAWSSPPLRLPPLPGSKRSRVKRPQVSVRLYMSEQMWADVSPHWTQYQSDYKVRVLTVEELVAGSGEGTKVLDAEAAARKLHHNVVMLDLDPRYNMRKALTMLELLWRRDEYGKPAPYSDALHKDLVAAGLGRTVKLMNFSGDINGRQMPNKSEDHGTVLTDQIYRVDVKSDGLSASTAGPKACQAISRVCGVSGHNLNSFPKVWCTSDTRGWIRDTQSAQQELCHLQSNLPEGQNVHDLLRGGKDIDAARYPTLAQIVISAHNKIARAKNPDKVSIQTKVLAPGTKGSRAAGESFAECEGVSNQGQPRRQLQLQFKQPAQESAVAGVAEANFQPPEDPQAADRYREEQMKCQDSGLLSSLKSAAKNVIFGLGRVESSYEEWKAIVAHYKHNHVSDGEELPDFDSVLPDADVERIVRDLPDELQAECVRLFEGKHRHAARLLPGRITVRSPGGLFERAQNDDGWVMADSIRERLESLSTMNTAGTQRRNLVNLWKGAGKSAHLKGHMVIRLVLRHLLTRFVEQAHRLPMEGEVGFVNTLVNRATLNRILDKCNYKSDWAIRNLTEGGRDRGAWTWATLKKSPFRSSTESHDVFTLSPTWLRKLDELPANVLTFENLHEDDAFILFSEKEMPSLAEEHGDSTKAFASCVTQWQALDSKTRAWWHEHATQNPVLTSTVG